MPKNKGKGGKNRRRGKNENEGVKRDLNYKEDGQEYARVERLLGNGRLEAYCFDGTKRLCNIRGKLKKKVWINAGDIILVGLRDYQDNKADVIMKYLNDEARTLKALGEIPDSVQVDDYNDIQFDENAVKMDWGPDGEDDGSGISDSDDESDESGSDFDGVLLKSNPNHPCASKASTKKQTELAAKAHKEVSSDDDNEMVKFANKDKGDSDEEESDSDESDDSDDEDGEKSYRYKDKYGPDKFKKDKRVNHPTNKYGRGGKGRRGK